MKTEMTTYEKCKAVRRCITSSAAEVMQYHNWDDSFCAKRIRDIPNRLRAPAGPLNIAELTEEQRNDLDFGRWSEDNPMRLIPLWLFQFLPDEIETECIDGVKSILRRADMDDDHRFGCLAYGILPFGWRPPHDEDEVFGIMQP